MTTILIYTLAACVAATLALAALTVAVLAACCHQQGRDTGLDAGDPPRPEPIPVDAGHAAPAGPRFAAHPAHRSPPC